MNPDFLWPNLTSLPYFRGFLRAIEARLLQSVRLERPLLDVGCGDGHFGAVTFQEPPNLGLDPDPRSLREARLRNAYASLVAAEGARLPLRGGAFASAVSNSVLEHIPDVRPVLAEVARVLKVRGRFVFTVPNPGYLDRLSIPPALAGLKLHRWGDRYREWFRTVTRVHQLEWEPEWEGWLQAAGFEVERTLRYFSPQAMRVLEWGHYFGVPALVARRLTGRWIIAPSRWNLWWTARMVRPYYDSPAAGDGVFTLYVARKR